MSEISGHCRCRCHEQALTSADTSVVRLSEGVSRTADVLPLALTAVPPSLPASRRHSRDMDLYLVPPTARLLSIEQAARCLGIGRTTMFDLIRDGAVETVRIGHRHLVPVEALAEFIEVLRRGPAA